MTNSFIVAIWVLLSTNTMDTLLTPVGDDILRSKITIQTHIYTIPGHATVTNVVPVMTNSVYLRKQWIELPSVPPLPMQGFTNSLRQTGPWTYTNDPPNFDPRLWNSPP